MKLKWLDTKPSYNTGITFGLPWEKGKLKDTNHTFKLNDRTIQTWPTAFWPDGSIKWTGHAAVIGEEEKQHVKLTNDRESPSQEDKGITILNNESTIKINNGKYDLLINKNSNFIIDKVRDLEKNVVAENLQLISSIKEEEVKENKKISHITEYASINHSVSIEIKGTQYVVLKIEGIIGTKDLPFTIRLKIFNNTNEIKIISTNFYNIDDKKHTIESVGLIFQKAFNGDSYNKHVKLISSEGIYNEPSQILSSRRYRFNDYYKSQIDGELIELNDASQYVIEQAVKNAVWNDFKYTQIDHRVGKYQKRANSNNAWINIPEPIKTNGMMNVSDELSSISFGLRYFNDKHPSQLSVTNLNEEKSTLAVWFWSPDSEPMDLRHYDDKTHVESAYEGFPEMRATAKGIANTSEVTIKFYSDRPSDEELIEDSVITQRPPLLVANSNYYYRTKATGEWPLITKDNSKIEEIENQLENLTSFYLNEIQQRNWTGYWNYGDVMHSYDHVRSQWFYDQGGYAWQNTELVPNLWLWYSFFRTVDSDIFRFAEVMTKHNSEVDRYHFGEYKGLGSRHNVSHWGCGCKEARISMACLFKYYYYLTADERTLELLDETKDADKRLDYLDPMREFYPKLEEDHMTHARSGPDWVAFASNWLSQWERNQDEEYLNKIKTGLENLKNSPHRLLSGPNFEYSTLTNELHYLDTGNSRAYHMIISFGGPQVWIELANLMEDDEFKDMIAEFGKVYAMSNDEKNKFSNGKFSNDHFHWTMFASGLMAYAASHYKDNKLAQTAWTNLLDESISGVTLPIEVNQKTDDGRVIDEIPWMTTNVASQWSLNIMMALKYIKNKL